MQYTEHLRLNKPESTDLYNIDDFNENFDVIDDLIDEKVSTSYLRDFIISKPYTSNCNVTGDTVTSGEYYIGEVGYKPIFAQLNILNGAKVYCLYCRITEGRAGYAVTYDLYNLSDSLVNAEIEITVLYVKAD